MKLLHKLILLCVVFISTTINAQIEFPEDKVNWQFSVEQKGCEATIVATVKVVENWHINAIFLPEGGFSLPSEFIIEGTQDYELIGKVKEPKPHFKHDEAAGEDLYLHDGTVKFTQKIKILSEKDFELKGSYGFQTCDEDHCLPPYYEDFKVNVKGCSSVSEVKELNIEDKFTLIEGDEAKDENGVNYVKVNNTWHQVPKGNSIEFFKKYIAIIENE